MSGIAPGKTHLIDVEALWFQRPMVEELTLRTIRGLLLLGRPKMYFLQESVVCLRFR